MFRKENKRNSQVARNAQYRVAPLHQKCMKEMVSASLSCSENCSNATPIFDGYCNQPADSKDVRKMPHCDVLFRKMANTLLGTNCAKAINGRSLLCGFMCNPPKQYRERVANFLEIHKLSPSDYCSSCNTSGTANTLMGSGVEEDVPTFHSRVTIASAPDLTDEELDYSTDNDDEFEYAGNNNTVYAQQPLFYSRHPQPLFNNSQPQCFYPGYHQYVAHQHQRFNHPNHWQEPFSHPSLWSGPLFAHPYYQTPEVSPPMYSRLSLTRQANEEDELLMRSSRAERFDRHPPSMGTNEDSELEDGPDGPPPPYTPRASSCSCSCSRTITRSSTRTGVSVADLSDVSNEQLSPEDRSDVSNEQPSPEEMGTPVESYNRRGEQRATQYEEMMGGEDDYETNMIESQRSREAASLTCSPRRSNSSSHSNQTSHEGLTRAQSVDDQSQGSYDRNFITQESSRQADYRSRSTYRVDQYIDALG